MPLEFNCDTSEADFMRFVAAINRRRAKALGKDLMAHPNPQDPDHPYDYFYCENDDEEDDE